MKKLIFILACGLLTSCSNVEDSIDHFLNELAFGPDSLRVPAQKSTYEYNGVIYRYAPDEFRYINHCNTGRPILWDDQMQMCYEFGEWSIEYSYGADGDSCISHVHMFFPKGEFRQYGFEAQEAIDLIKNSNNEYVPKK
jgi:hypothetical protein